MSGPAAAGTTGTSATPERRLPAYAARYLLAFVLAGAGLGALAGIVWWQVVDLAAYTVSADGRATTTERGLTRFFAGDAWFCLLGAVAGLLIGVVAWRLFRRSGWLLPVLVVVTAMMAALVCWLVGYQLGPGDFVHRLAIAEPGQQVPIALTLRAPVSLVVWPFAAVVPVLLGSSLGRDDEEPRPIRRRRSDEVSADPAVEARGAETQGA